MNVKVGEGGDDRPVRYRYRETEDPRTGEPLFIPEATSLRNCADSAACPKCGSTAGFTGPVFRSGYFGSLPGGRVVTGCLAYTCSCCSWQRLERTKDDRGERPAGAVAAVAGAQPAAGLSCPGCGSTDGFSGPFSTCPSCGWQQVAPPPPPPPDRNPGRDVTGEFGLAGLWADLRFGVSWWRDLGFGACRYLMDLLWLEPLRAAWGGLVAWVGIGPWRLVAAVLVGLLVGAWLGHVLAFRVAVVR